MPRSRYLWKLYAGYASLILIATGIVGYLVARSLKEQSLGEIDQRLHAEASLLRVIAADAFAASSEAPGEPDLQARILRLGDEIGTRLTVIRADGKVLADSEKNPAQMDNHAGRPEVVQATDEDLGKVTRFSNSVQMQMRYLALPLRDETGVLLGWARTSLPLDVLEDRMGQLQKAVFLGTAIAIVIALVLGLLLARRITEPLLSMAVAADAIATGNYLQRVPIYSRDELGKLGVAFNTMSRKLRDTIAEVQADRANLAAILGSMAEGVIAVDPEERIVHLNRTAGRLLELDPKKVLGQPIWQVTRDQQISEALTKAMESNALIEAEVRRPGVKDQVIELRASPLRNGGEEGTSGAVLLLDDVTSLRQLETMRQDFVGNVSHELKTPVAAIRGLVETLLDDPEMAPETARRFLDKIGRQTERLSNLVTDLLSLSRLESESHDLRVEPIDLRDTVIDTVRALQQRSEARSVEVVTSLPDEAINVLGEGEALEQAVANLVDNAIAYSPPGEQVTVRAHAVDDSAVIEVEDRGIGIAMHDQERIFERFYRVDKARSKEVGGTGLGLAIVKHIAMALGGRVSVDSQLGEGSAFRIHLPLYRE